MQGNTGIRILLFAPVCVFALITNLRPAKLTVLTTLPGIPWLSTQERLHPHFAETLLALAENVRLAHVVDVRVLIDHFPKNSSSGDSFDRVHSADTLDNAATTALREFVRLSVRSLSNTSFGWSDLHGPSLAHNLQKLRVHVHGVQPTYAHMFRYADAKLRGRLVALLNADIVLRNTDMFDGDAFDAHPPLALTISVRPPTGYFLHTCLRPDGSVLPVADRCNLTTWRHSGKSWDVHVFKAPVVNARYDLLEQLRPYPVFMNAVGAEYRAGLFLSHSGYELHNPCRLNLAEHWHCTPPTHKRLRTRRSTMTQLDTQQKGLLRMVHLAKLSDFDNEGRVHTKCHTRGTKPSNSLAQRIVFTKV